MSKNYLKDELKNFGPVVLLNYGSGSVKRNGIYDQVVAILKEAGKTIVENPGVMSNPTPEKLREGIKTGITGGTIYYPERKRPCHERMARTLFFLRLLNLSFRLKTAKPVLLFIF